MMILFASVIVVNAQQDTTGTQSDRATTGQSADQTSHDQHEYSDKDMISASELPQNIREQLQTQDYTGWTVRNAYRKMKDNQTVYAVELTNGSEKKKVKFDAEGNVLKEKTKRDKDQ